MDEAVTVVLSENLNDLHKLIEAIEVFRGIHGLTQTDCYSVHLVCEEVFVNFINYSVTSAMTKQMTINLYIEGSLLTITIKDNGHPMNPLTAPIPDIETPLENRTTGGLGIFLVRHWADKLDYCYKDTNNILTIQKKLIVSNSER
jgi:serine/threonine-protein kinase RsbW